MAGSPSRAAGRRLQLPLLSFLQGATAVLFAVFVRYNHKTDAAFWHRGNHSNADNEFYFCYPSFQDVHAMVFVGFGFLMVFLQHCGFSSVGFTFLLAAFALQWSTLVQGVLHCFRGGHIHVGVESMINADFCAGAVLISFGAVLGKTGPAQLLLMALLEVVLFGINKFVLLHLLGVRVWGGMEWGVGGGQGERCRRLHDYPHLWCLLRARPFAGSVQAPAGEEQAPPGLYHSDLFAMIGTIFLWIFWPSFNAALTSLGAGQHRAALNTYYSLAASTLGTFALSALVGEDGRLDMVHIQNAALAGGVVVGTSSEMMLTPFGALAAGFLAGTVSTLGYKFFTPILESKFKVQDTCGVHNLHGMPGVLGVLLGVLVAGLATHEAYGDGLESVFPLIAEGQRSATSQAMYQLFGLFVTLMFASVGGGLGGLLLKLPFLDSPPDSQCYEDQVHWQAPGATLSPLPTPAFHVPGQHEDKAQRPLRGRRQTLRPNPLLAPENTFLFGDADWLLLGSSF
ncbi:RHBG isoform 1 [Pongo abelii]|uniref:Ammonium transporter Rh type B n=1 Tax=Pongo abelii TaxID=9601 RepID=A0A2J8VGV6_PONAB|nr:RHBG isoform 1 [Pongo abelii]